MKQNSTIQKIFENHTKHIPRETIHLGDAETWKDILKAKKEIKAKTYMLSKCCIDNIPTLQLATKKKVRRMRLGMFSDKEKREIIAKLEKIGLKYRETSYLALNPDFTETKRCKFQKKILFLYKLRIKIREYINKIKY